MKIIIVEDLDCDFSNLQTFLTNALVQNQFTCEIVRYTNGEDFLSALSDGTVLADSCFAFFLDIILNGQIDGMDLAYKIRDFAPIVPIIFTTSEPSYALKSYRVHSLDYLLKPYQSSDIFSIITRLVKSSQAQSYIIITSNRCNIKINLCQLVYAVMQDHKLNIVLADGRRIFSYMRFADFYALLPQLPNLVFPYRGIMVNLSFVDQISKSSIFLTTGEHVPISRSKSSLLINLFNQYLIEQTREGLLL